jgi:hypothetical protein
MSKKSKNVSVSKKKLAKTGQDLEINGTVAEIEGMNQVAAGAQDLRAAKTAVKIGVAEVAAASSDLTRAEDAALAAQRMQQLSDAVGVAGVVDVAEGVDMVMKGGDVRAMSAIVGLMSREELDRGLELARLAGELWTVSDVVGMMQMPVLSDFLEERGMHLQEIAVDQLLRSTGTRALAGAMSQAGRDIEALGENEMEEGMVRVAVSEAATKRSKELSKTSDALASRGVGELAEAVMARDLAREASAAGVTKIAKGAETMGAGEATVQTGEVLEERAKR